jgi:hypothetical protein
LNAGEAREWECTSTSMVDVPPQFRSDWSADCFVGSPAMVLVSNVFLEIQNAGYERTAIKTRRANSELEGQAP